MALRGGRSGSFLGVDIGSATIKAVELTRGRRSGEAWVVLAAGEAPTPPEAVQGGRVTNPQAVGAAIRELLGRAGIRTRRAVASINGQVAIVREVRLPNLPASELRQAARFEVERYLPYPITEVTFDTVVTGEVKDNGNTKLEILVVAARTDVLSQHVAALRAAGLDAQILDVELFALARAMAAASAAPPEQVAIYIHIGAETTAIEISSRGVPRVMRSVAFGGATITNLLAERLGLEAGKAEALKLEMSTAAARETETPASIQLQEVVMAGLADLTTEVRRSLEYYGGRFHGAVPEYAVVTGGSAQLPGLTQYLATDLDLPVEVGDPFHGLTDGRSNAAAGPAPAAMAVAVGLAQRGGDEP